MQGAPGSNVFDHVGCAIGGVDHQRTLGGHKNIGCRDVGLEQGIGSILSRVPHRYRVHQHCQANTALAHLRAQAFDAVGVKAIEVDLRHVPILA